MTKTLSLFKIKKSTGTVYVQYSHMTNGFKFDIIRCDHLCPSELEVIKNSDAEIRFVTN